MAKQSASHLYVRLRDAVPRCRLQRAGEQQPRDQLIEARHDDGDPHAGADQAADVLADRCRWPEGRLSTLPRYGRSEPVSLGCCESWFAPILL